MWSKVSSICEIGVVVWKITVWFVTVSILLSLIMSTLTSVFVFVINDASEYHRQSIHVIEFEFVLVLYVMFERLSKYRLVLVSIWVFLLVFANIRIDVLVKVWMFVLRCVLLYCDLPCVNTPAWLIIVITLVQISGLFENLSSCLFLTFSSAIHSVVMLCYFIWVCFSFWIDIRFDIFFATRSCFKTDQPCRKSLVLVFVAT